ncbi:DUF3822 family protein [Spongiivirga citrea]|uniref:DUF3822 family protein n=1 Tax=Spongiivirga citrea TaxID=1481457 RepID=A0A6M0CID5_9FLAO|nr:DUF3822 family protein [Spongiivirga citrea]NER17641.1 DUF3822 family protein [Spongiivirga citrea]
MTPPKIINRNIEDNTLLELSIQLSLGGLSFCILDKSINTLVHYTSFPFHEVATPNQLLDKVKRVFASSLVLQQPFQKVKIIYVNELNSFVPTALFSDKNLEDYLKFNTKVLPNDFITFDVLSNTEMVNVYIPYVNINNFIFEQYGTFEYKHFASLLVNSILNTAPSDEQAAVYVYVHDQQFDVVVVKQRKLQLFNTFKHTNKEDFIYHLLFVAEQLGLNPDKFPLYFLGDVKKDDDLYEIAYTYIRNVDFGKRNDIFEYKEELAPPTDHEDYVLLNSF